MLKNSEFWVTFEEESVSGGKDVYEIHFVSK
jgi:hypothetical protein